MQGFNKQCDTVQQLPAELVVAQAAIWTRGMPPQLGTAGLWGWLPVRYCQGLQQAAGFYLSCLARRCH